MSRVLAVPAVLCVLVGAALGVWGWSQRDDSRDRVIQEQADDELVLEGGLFGPSPIDVAAQEVEVCGLLGSASRLEPTFNPLGPGGPTQPPGVTTFPPSSVELVARLLSILQPDIVTGFPTLDRPDIRAGIQAQRDAVDRADQAGREVGSDPEVVQAALSLGQALDEVC